MGDIVFLAHRAPFPPDRGDRIRSCHIVRALAKLARVHIVAFADSAADSAAAEAFRGEVASLTLVARDGSRARAAAMALAGRRPVSLAAFGGAAMRAAVADAIAGGTIDTIYAFSGQMAQFVPADWGGRFVMDFVDVDSAKFEDYAATARGPMRWVHAREARLLARFEAAVARRADLSLFVSEAEAALFRSRAGLKDERVAALGNGIDVEFFRADATFEPLPPRAPFLLFTGQMDYPPNIDAVDRFAREVLPRVREHAPQVEFAIVGRAPTARVAALAGLPGVTVTGAVSDVRPWLAAAEIVVAPLMLARGVQNKVLEAMAMGRPVIASPAAAEGIDARPGFDLLVAEVPHMAELIVRLLVDPVRRGTIGRSARSLVEGRYRWEAQLAGLAEMVGRSPVAHSEAA